MGNTCQNQTSLKNKIEATPDKDTLLGVGSTSDVKTPTEILAEKERQRQKLKMLTVQHRSTSSIHSPPLKIAVQVKTLNNTSERAKKILATLPKFNFKKAKEVYLGLSNKQSEDSSSSSHSEDRENLKSNDFLEIGPFRYFSDESTYKGSYLNGKREGVGTNVTSYGDIYQGSWVNDVPEGYGLYIQFNGDYYKGEFKDGYPEGKGVMYYYESKISFEGEVVKGMKNGKGSETYPNGCEYQGKNYY